MKRAYWLHVRRRHTTRDEYMKHHHHITETQIGLARLHLSTGKADKAKDALDVCSVKLKGIYKERCVVWGLTY